MGDKLRIEILAGRLASGNASQQERDELTAMMALAVKDVMNIDDKIAAIHTNLCEHCSIRKRVNKIEEAQEKVKNTSFISKDKLPWMVILGLVVIIATLLGVDIKAMLN